MDLTAAPYGSARYPFEGRMDERIFARFHLDAGTVDVVMQPLETIVCEDRLGFAGIETSWVRMIAGNSSSPKRFMPNREPVSREGVVARGILAFYKPKTPDRPTPSNSHCGTLHRSWNISCLAGDITLRAIPRVSVVFPDCQRPVHRVAYSHHEARTSFAQVPRKTGGPVPPCTLGCLPSCG